MRCLLLHVKEYRIKVTGLANRPANIEPEHVAESEQHVENAICCLVTIEEGDSTDVHKITNLLLEDVKKIAKDTGERHVILLPFAHLSSRLAPSKEAQTVFNEIESVLEESFEITRAHFGSDKEYLLHVYGHRGNTRFREYTI